MRIGLLPRVMVALGTVALIPLLLVSLSLVRLNREAMATQVLRTHAVAARATADRLAARVGSLRSAAAGVAGDPGLASGSGAGRAAAQRLLQSLVQGRRQVVAAAVTRGDGTEVVRVQRRNHAATVGELFGRPPGPDSEVVTADGRTWLLVASELPGRAGWVRLAAAAAELETAVRPEELGRSAALAVVNGHGEAVLPVDMALDGFSRGLRQAALGGRLSGAGRYPDRGGDVLGAFAPVPGTSWMVLSQQPAEVAEAVARNMRRNASFAVAGVVVLAAVLTGVAYRSLVRPLRRLIAAQRRLAGLAERPATGNEIEALRESLDALQRRMKEEDELRDVFLGRFQVTDMIGEGAMGTVFRGWDPKLQRPVALKTIRLGRELAAGKQREQVERLLHEAVAAARLSHPNVVAVYDVVGQDDAGFIAMEYVEGLSLQDLLQRDRVMAPAQAVPAGAAVAAALAAAHAERLVHHDVKPGNVLLGYDGAIKVTDFGIARFVTAVAEESGEVFGTPGYLPPEALRGEGYDELGDIFALGAMLYRCLGGKLPYFGSSVRRTVGRTLGGPTRDLREINPEVPGELSALVMRLIAPRREDRETSARTAAGELELLARARSWRWTPPERSMEDTVREVVDAIGEHSCLVRTRTLPGAPGHGASG